MSTLSILLFLAICVFVFIMIIAYNKQYISSKTTKVLNTFQKEDKHIKLFFYESQLLDRLNVNPNQVRIFIYIERILLVVLFVLSYFFIGFLGLGFVGAIAINFFFNDKTKKLIAEEGVSDIQPTLDFINFFCPTVIGGAATEQALLKYIQRLSDDDIYKLLLTEYYASKKEDGDLGYKIPDRIKIITEVYENASYNEELGIEDYLDVVEEEKKALFKKQKYYGQYQNEYNSVVNPIKMCYIVLLPLIVLMTISMTGDFWNTIFGFFTLLVVLVIYAVFQLLLYNLNKSTIKNIF